MHVAGLDVFGSDSGGFIGLCLNVFGIRNGIFGFGLVSPLQKN